MRGDTVYVLHEGWLDQEDSADFIRVFANIEDARGAFTELLQDCLQLDEIDSLDDLIEYEPEKRYITPRGGWAEVQEYEVE